MIIKVLPRSYFFALRTFNKEAFSAHIKLVSNLLYDVLGVFIINLPYVMLAKSDQLKTWTWDFT